MADDDAEMGDFNPSSPPIGESSPILDSDGEDLADNYDADYERNDELDRYEEVNIDNEEQEEMSRAQRAQVEREMYERDRRAGKRVAAPFGLDSPDDPLANDFGVTVPQHMLHEEEFEEEGGEVNLEDYTGPLRNWLDEPKVQNEIKRKFREFLTSFRDEGGSAVYPERIQKMVVGNHKSLQVSYVHISVCYPALAIWTADEPQLMLELFDEVATQSANDLFPGYNTIQQQIHVRLTQLPISDKLRDLRHSHLNMLVKVSGVVTRRTDVYPQLESVRYDCVKCGYVMGPFLQRGHKDEVRPVKCPQCDSKGPFRLNVQETIYRNYQKLTLQEPPGSVPAGRVPRSRDVVLIDDLVDSVKPGEQIDVTGIYVNQMDHGINIQTGFPVFQTLIEANYIESKEHAFARDQITQDDEKRFGELSKRPDLADLIIRSIAPSIYGHQYIKRALMFAMFGGQEKMSKQKHRVRGDINVLILGDPGCGKSQFLKWVENVSPRAVYATGKGASAVGLTAGVRRDPITQEWTLEGGALVLADRGICMIDEFDKMNEQDRTSIHEAMEQQSISISKAGIVTRLQARCSVIAAANPVRGRYDGSLTFVDNVDLTDPILSRFDILCVVRDLVDPSKDERVARWVCDNHIRSHPDKDEKDEEKENENKEDEKMEEDKVEETDERPETLSTDDLRKYIAYAKANCNPKLHNIDRRKISAFYADLRQKSMTGGGIPIAVRHIESVLRMSEANARLHLRDNVCDEDVDIAIRTLLQSFIATQKQAVANSLTQHFQSYLHYKRDNIEILLHLLNKEVSAANHLILSRNRIDIKLNLLQKKALNYGINNVNVLLEDERFTSSGFQYDSKEKLISKVYDFGRRKQTAV